MILSPATSDKPGFSLDLAFGQVQPNASGFKGGGEKLFITGHYTVLVSNVPNFKGEIYHLTSDRFPTGIALRKVNGNLLHLLAENNGLMIGNAGWSYTLNHTDAAKSLSSEFDLRQTTPIPAEEHSDTASTFVGRTSCSPELKGLNRFSEAGCERIKWELTLHRDSKTRLPTTFLLKSVYVGLVDAVYTRTGKWDATAGMKADPGAVVYILKLNGGEAEENLVFLKGDNNVLFFIGKDANLMVGNENHSFTLNRVK